MSSPNVFQEDPYLQYQPGFAYTLPIQLFVNGITLTLLCILFIHLLFTAQYHYPLAPLNYILQFTSVLVCVISVVIKVTVVLQNSSDSGDVWPYSLVYVAVPIPPTWWSTAQSSLWFLLQALCVGLSNITHIQFLTLLFPSRTEARLIIFVLGPLAIASSGLVFVALSNSQTALDIGDAIRNTLNSTLLLIFTIALLIWGLLVNRRRAWRSDGGTAIFGIGSLSLAIISTSFNFVAIAEDGIDWLQHLLFAAVLWQIWLGWWWWVGSGMGIGEVEDIMQKAERKKRKAAKRAARLRSSNALTKRTRTTSSTAEAPSAAANAVSSLSHSVTGILRNRSLRSNSGLRRRTSQTANSGSHMGDVEEGIELNNFRQSEVPRTASPAATTQRVEFTTNTDASRGQPSTNSETSSTSQTPSLHPPRTVRQAFSFPTTWLLVYMRKLRHAHEDATKQQVLQRAELRQRVFVRDDPSPGTSVQAPSGTARKGKSVSIVSPSTGDPVTEEPPEGAVRERRISLAELGAEDGVGWGLGSFGIKEHEASARRLREAGEIMRSERLLGDDERAAAQSADEAVELGVEAGPSTRPIRRVPVREDDQGVSEQDDTMGDSVPQAAMTGGSMPAIASAGPSTSQAETIAPDTSTRNPSQPGPSRRGSKREDDWEDVESNSSSGDLTDSEGNGNRTTGRGWSWWGPLKNLRRADRSQF